MSKFKPGDRILYKHPKDKYPFTATIASIGEEDVYWIKWDGTEHFTENDITDVDSDSDIQFLNSTTNLLYGSKDDRN